MTTSEQLVLAKSTYLSYITILRRFFQLIIKIAKLIDSKVSKTSIDAALILTRHFSILPNVENTENRKRYAEFSPKHFIYNKDNQHTTLKGFVPQSHNQLKYYAFLESDNIHKAIKLLVDKGICTGIVKCSTNAYCFSDLGIDETELIGVSQSYWGNKELLEASNAFINFMRKRVVDTDGNELRTSYLEGRRALMLLSLFDDKLPSCNYVYKNYGIHKDSFIGICDALQKKEVLIISDRLYIDWYQVFYHEDTLEEEERKKAFLEEEENLQVRNKSSRIVNWKFVNEYCTTRHIVGKSMLSGERALVVHIISKLAKEKNFEIKWNFLALNYIMKALTGVSYGSQQKEELLKRCSYKTFESIFNNCLETTDKRPWFEVLMSFYDIKESSEGCSDLNEFKGPYLSEYTFIDDRRVGTLAKVSEKDSLKKRVKSLSEEEIPSFCLELDTLSDIWGKVSTNYRELKELGFCDEYAHLISTISNGAKEHFDLDVDWSLFPIFGRNGLLHHITRESCVFIDPQGYTRGYDKLLKEFRKIDRGAFERALIEIKDKDIRDTKTFFLSYLEAVA